MPVVYAKAEDSVFEELVTGFSEQELEYFGHLCNTLDFASTTIKGSYVFDTLNSVCSSLDTVTTASRIVFNQDEKTIVVETAGKVVETIVYETEMQGVRAAAASIIRAGFSSANPWVVGGSIVGAGGVYIVGEKSAKYFAEQAGVETKELASYLWDSFNEQDVVLNRVSDVTPIENGDYVIKDVIPLQSGQTISHIAQNTPYNSIELLEYNNLTLEQAKNLPIGFEVKIPKEVTSLESVDGTIKFYENHDGGGIASVPSPDGKVYLEYKEGDFFSSSPDKVSFGNETWTKGVDRFSERNVA